MANAAQLAFFDAADDDLSLIVRDTQGTPAGAVVAARSAIDARAGIILGPLFSSSVEAVAPIAEAAGVNLIGFSNDESIARPGAYIMGLTPSEQVRRIVEYSTRQGLRRFAALAPDNRYGRIVVDSLDRAVAENGAILSRVAYYDPQATDVSPYVIDLASGSGSEGFDAILLPEGGDRVRTVAPLLPFYDIDPSQVQFLGTALWTDITLTREPALVGGWFAAPPPDTWQQFARRYSESFGGAPPSLATLGYDAMALAAVLARGQKPYYNPNTTFGTAAIEQASGFRGLDGIFRFRPDGTIARGLAVVELVPNGFRVREPAPSSFQLVGPSS